MFDLSNLMEPKLRIAIVANANSIHTVRWVSWLEKKGHQVSIFSLKEGKKCTYFGPEPCLLYTSPSPRDQRGSRMPSSA